MRFVRSLILACALFACTIAALAQATTTSVSIFMPNRTFGLGEQHVYVIDRSQTINVRYRNQEGDVVTKSIKRDDSHSVALTVEGYAVDGAAILAIAADSPPSAKQAGPSPAVGADGSVQANGSLGQLGVTSMILRNLPRAPLLDGTKWNGGGVLGLPFGVLNLRVVNSAAAWAQDPTVLQVISAGTIDAKGSVAIGGLGKTDFHGGGTCNGASFIDQQNALVMGSTFNVASRGNLSRAGDNVGTYTLTGSYTLKLARYIAGRTPPPSGAPSNAPGFMNGAPLDSDVIRQGAGNPIASPAPTDNIFSGASPFSTSTPLPEQSLAPVPVPVSSGAPLASPPAPPPTPFPTITPR